MQCVPRDENSTILTASQLSDTMIEEYRSCLSTESFKNRWPVVGYLIILTLVGFLGNVVVIAVYWTRFRACASRVFVLVMAVYDITTSTVGLPLQIITIRYAYDTYSYWLCRGMFAIVTFPTQASGLVLAAVAMDRFHRVFRPHSKQLTARQCIWVNVGIIVAVHVVFGVYVPFYGIHYVDSHIPGVSVHMCWSDNNYVHTTYPEAYSYTVNIIFFGSLLPMTMSYVLIAVKVWKKPVHGNKAADSDSPKQPSFKWFRPSTWKAKFIATCTISSWSLTIMRSAESGVGKFPTSTSESLDPPSYTASLNFTPEERNDDLKPTVSVESQAVLKTTSRVTFHTQVNGLDSNLEHKNDTRCESWKCGNVAVGEELKENVPIDVHKTFVSEEKQEIQHKSGTSVDATRPVSQKIPTIDCIDELKENARSEVQKLSPPKEKQDLINDMDSSGVAIDDIKNESMLTNTSPEIKNKGDNSVVSIDDIKCDSLCRSTSPEAKNTEDNAVMADIKYESKRRANSLDVKGSVSLVQFVSSLSKMAINESEYTGTASKSSQKKDNVERKESSSKTLTETNQITPATEHDSDHRENTQPTTKQVSDHHEDTQQTTKRVSDHLENTEPTTVQLSDHHEDTQPTTKQVSDHQENTQPTTKQVSDHRENTEPTTVQVSDNRENTQPTTKQVSNHPGDNQQTTKQVLPLSEDTQLSAEKTSSPAASAFKLHIRSVVSAQRLAKKTVSAHHLRVRSRTTIMMSVLTVLYIINWVPHNYMRFTRKDPVNWCDNFVDCGSNFYALCIRSYYINTGVNAFVYSFCCSRFRMECVDMLKSMWQKIKAGRF